MTAAEKSGLHARAEKVGQLRQAPHELEAGKSYWMAFSNSGRLLKPGDRVDIVIGNFHARGLLVE